MSVRALQSLLAHTGCIEPARQELGGGACILVVEPYHRLTAIITPNVLASESLDPVWTRAGTRVVAATNRARLWIPRGQENSALRQIKVDHTGKSRWSGQDEPPDRMETENEPTS